MHVGRVLVKILKMMVLPGSHDMKYLHGSYSNKIVSGKYWRGRILKIKDALVLLN